VTEPPQEKHPKRCDPNAWLAEHGDTLFRYAMLHLRDPSLAEDVVQETLLAAFQSHENFSGQSSERTWLVGILKHKIIDLIRKKSREPSFENIEDQANATLDETTDALFDERGEWAVPPQDWGNPETALDQKRFWEALEICLSRMPPQLAAIFALREFSGLSTEELCKELEISSTNSWVMLYRARVSLRQCLETNWIGDEKGRRH
jgi:RNA polymerase sigma-70 factor (ECF subfamily)